MLAHSWIFNKWHERLENIEAGIFSHRDECDLALVLISLQSDLLNKALVITLTLDEAVNAYGFNILYAMKSSRRRNA